MWHPQMTITVPMTISLLFRVLCRIWFASEVIVAVGTRTRGGKGNIRDRGSMLILWIVITTAITGCEWLSAVVTAPLFRGAPWLRMASFLVLLIGITIRWTAIFTLGKAFSANVAIREEQKLKQSGLYRFVRHPSYSGLLLILLAVGLQSRNWAGLLVLIVPTTAALIYRIHVEEAALSEAFGEQYAGYSKATWRLVPGLY
jgi:protein-S-isoprenylcysteine O-methyltransferase Ste14